MIIAEALVKSSEFGLTHVHICSDELTAKEYEDQSTDDLVYLNHDKPLSDAIMKLAATRELPAEFKFLGDQCELLSYSYVNDERFYNKYRKNHVVDRVTVAPASEIIVYTGRCSCPRCYEKYGFDGIENICGTIPLLGDLSKTVEIDIQRCNRCRSFFVDKQSLELYEKKYGRLNIIQLTPREFIRRYLDQNDGYYAPDSVLSRNGYFANKDRATRRRILIRMMENGVSKAEIKDKLTEFLQFRGDRCYKAAPIWREDLDFVNEYHLEKEQKVNFK